MYDVMITKRFHYRRGFFKIKLKVNSYLPVTEFKKEGPGPAYSLDSSLTSKGRELRPAFSMLGRAKTPSKYIVLSRKYLKVSGIKSMIIVNGYT